MKIIPLYKYERETGQTTVSPIMPSCEYTEMYRLTADKGMLLTDGVTTTLCVDTTDTSVWSEIIDNGSYAFLSNNNILTASAYPDEQGRIHNE